MKPCGRCGKVDRRLCVLEHARELINVLEQPDFDYQYISVAALLAEEIARDLNMLLPQRKGQIPHKAGLSLKEVWPR